MKPFTEYIADGMIFHGEIPHVMGTRLEMLVVGMEEGTVMALWERLHELVFRLDGMLNRFDPESEVSRLNMSGYPAGCPMSAELASVFLLAQEYKTKTQGLFDVTWNGGKLDFGGFAKGYFLRICGEILLESGVESAFVDFGNSSILGIGHHPYGDSWKVEVMNPYTHLPVKELSLIDNAMSTSGNTPSYSGHVRNPLTGEACSAPRLVSVVTHDPLDAEVLSTVLMIADADQSHFVRGEFPDAEFYTFI